MGPLQTSTTRIILDFTDQYSAGGVLQAYKLWSMDKINVTDVYIKVRPHLLEAIERGQVRGVPRKDVSEILEHVTFI